MRNKREEGIFTVSDFYDEFIELYETGGRYTGECDACGKKIKPEDMVISWRESIRDSWPRMEELYICHQGDPCYSKSLPKTYGASYGPDWSTHEVRRYFREGVRFRLGSYRDKLFNALDYVDEIRGQRRKGRLS